MKLVRAVIPGLAMIMAVTACVAMSRLAFAQTTIVFTPTEPAPGVEVTFEGFPACQSDVGEATFELRWDGVQGPQLFRVSPTQDGPIDGRFLVPPAASPGPHLVVPVCESDQSYPVDSVPLTVAEPPELHAAFAEDAAGTLRITGTGYEACDRDKFQLFILLDGTKLHVADAFDVVDEGVFAFEQVPLPEDIALGQHQLTSTCGIPGQDPMSMDSVDIVVAGQTPVAEPPELHAAFAEDAAGTLRITGTGYEACDRDKFQLFILLDGTKLHVADAFDVVDEGVFAFEQVPLPEDIALGQHQLTSTCGIPGQDPMSMDSVDIVVAGQTPVAEPPELHAAFAEDAAGTLRITGTGYEACDRDKFQLFILLDGTKLHVADAFDVVDEGVFAFEQVPLPEDIALGQHQLTSTCGIPGQDPMSMDSVDIVVAGQTPVAEPPELHAAFAEDAAGTLRITGTGYEACDRDKFQLFILLDGTKLHVADAFDVVDEGVFAFEQVPLPEDIALGQHQLTSTCGIPGQDPMSMDSVDIVVAGQTPDGRDRSEFPGSLISLAEVSFSPAVVLRDIGLAALLMLLVGFPAELFNKTVEEHYDELSSWFGQGGRHFIRHQWPSVVTLPLFAAVAALLYALLDPGLTDDRASLALVIGLFVAILAVTIVFHLPASAYARAKVGGTGGWRVYPKAMVFAALCVALSRLASFRPGYVYGIIAGYVLVRGLSKANAGRSVAIGSVALLGFSLAAWLAWTPIDRWVSTPGRPSSLAALTVDALLAAVFVAGVEGLAFGLVPVRFLNGQVLARWNRPVWLALWGTAMFGFVHVLLDPAVGRVDRYVSTAIVSMILLFLAFGAASVVLWAYFRFRQPP